MQRATNPAQAVPKHGETTRRDLLDLGKSSLTWLERSQIRLIRASLRPGLPDRAIRRLQQSVGQWWIRAATSNLRRVHGLERLPRWDPNGSLVCVCNHRSFFDLYVTTAELVAHGLPHRILFPVRSTFFYDHPLGPFVNGVMSFFAMYPPIFRERGRAALNLASLDEIAELLRRGGFFVGLHPEGTRKKDDDPYTFLSPQTGVGRVIHKARVTVVPVFVHGLGNHLVEQVAGGILGTGPPIHIVFGAPIDFGSSLSEPASPRTYRRIAEQCLSAIGALGREEKALRAASAAEATAKHPV
ncbi:MAG: 1-acyl-sn-glycerol-3-phosphate acyltransferase [Myxococcota bacterium]|nr:1-acyl-sn-glycerol-3-phosphate acyltransferase [Myxococcota bacterium]